MGIFHESKRELRKLAAKWAEAMYSEHFNFLHDEGDPNIFGPTFLCDHCLRSLWSGEFDMSDPSANAFLNYVTNSGDYIPSRGDLNGMMDRYTDVQYRRTYWSLTEWQKQYGIPERDGAWVRDVF